MTMFFQAENFINDIFENCVFTVTEGQEFNAETVIKRVFPKIEEGDAGYWQKKNVTDAMNVLERMKLICGEIKPEYTKNVRLLKEVRYGQITALGNFFKKLPKPLKCFFISAYLHRKGALSVLGVLAFITLCRNAAIGITILSGWVEYIAALVLLYLLYLAFKRLID